MALNKRINPNPDDLAGVAELKYKFACRCCLKVDAEFIQLESVSVARSLDPASEEDKISLLRCLLFCVRAENAPELPQYICIECSKSLQVAYYFLQNAVRAHEILCRKLCPGKLWNAEGKRFNGALSQRLQPSPSPKETATSGDRTRPLKSTRQECQVCGGIFHSRMELKLHLRQHTDGISHHCKMCNFTTLKQRQLLDHYRCDHAMTPSQAEEHVKASPLPISPIKEDEVKAVCTLEDMELLIPTVLTPDDYAQPTIDSEQLRDLEQQLAASMGDAVTGVDTLTSTLPPMDTAHNVSIGTEYLVLPDGSLQQVNGGGVVIEYIDDSKPQPPPQTTPNPPHINISLQNLLGNHDENEGMDIDVNELIVEDMMINKPTISTAIPNPPKPKPAIGGSPNYKHKCSICPRMFSSVARLKSHQLTHSNLPKFFCDQCNFYSLRSVDLIEHYKKTHHRLNENGATSQDPAPVSEETGVYSCDMCLFETRTCNQLRVHYTERHEIQPTEVQLRPNWTNNRATKMEKSSSGRQPEPADLPVAIKYPSIVADAQVPVQIQQQVPVQMQQEMQAQQQMQIQQQMQVPQQLQVQQQVLVQQQQPVAVTTPTTHITHTNSNINVVVDTTPLFYASTISSAVQPAVPVPVQAMPVPEQTMSVPVQVMPVLPPVATVVEPTNENNSHAFEVFPKIQPSNEQATEPVPVDPVPSANTSNISMFGDMQDFIDNTDVAAICTIPADDMPVVDGDDIVIDNNNISLDFDAENLFEEFEEEDDAVGEDEGEEEEEDEADNDDENDNNDAATDQNLLLTSDDDDVDDFDDEQSKHLQKPYCIYCNKKFTSQYKFENHMFVHRGLAPYRCELCTNLYNMKRLLIRHYKTVHKRMPTRDMVQAKGDKVLVTRTNIEKLYMDGVKSPMVMCAKCPFECEADGEMRKHLNAHHGINDGLSIHANEVFIIRKLPFECPRCIRSFAAKATLTRHLQRSHLVDTIIEMQTTHSSAATTTITTTTATIAGPVRDKEPFKDETMMMMTTTTAAAGNELGGNQDDGTAAPPKRERTVPEEDVDPVTLDAATAATTAAIAAAISSASVSPSATTALAPSASNLYPTPTPFDFDYDIMGSDAQRSQVSTPTSHPQLGSPGCGLLNGSDKLLTTAAMGPYPTKGLRSTRRQAHSSIYVCKLCNKSFDELGKLVKHEMELHSNTEPSRWGYQHKCSICSTSYRTLTLLKFHMKRHVNRKSQCKLCPKIFVTNAELDRHMKVKHCREKLIGPCALDGCGKMFAFKHHMVRHQNASHLKSRHICEVCNKEMVTMAHLKSHMILHKGMVSYRCPECDRPYLRRGRLLSHLMKIHKKRLTEEEKAILFGDIKEEPSPPRSPNNLKVMRRRGRPSRKILEANETVVKEETHPAAELSK